jgi:hypothetical protein
MIETRGDSSLVAFVVFIVKVTFSIRGLINVLRKRETGGVFCVLRGLIHNFSLDQNVWSRYSLDTSRRES